MDVNSVTPKAADKCEPLYSKLSSNAWFWDKLFPSYSFRFNKVCNNNLYEYGHPLLGSLSMTFKFNKLTKKSVYFILLFDDNKLKWLESLWPYLLETIRVSNISNVSKDAA
jgi:hypothetical protein